MRKRIAELITFLLVVIYSVRVMSLNKNFDYSKEVHYKLGETVELGNNFFDSNMENTNSYSLTVLDAELMSIKDFNDKYIGETNYSDSSDDYVYLIKIMFRNNSNEKNPNSGIDLMQYIFQESSYTNLVESNYIEYLNDFNVTKFSLRPNSEKEIMIPFKVITHNVDIMQIINGEPQLVVSLYPYKQSIDLQ